MSELGKKAVLDFVREIGESRAGIKPKSRRYSPKDIEMVVEACRYLEVGEISKLSGIRTATIRVWSGRAKRAESKASNELEASEVKTPQYGGYHKHWVRVLDLWRSKPGLGPAQLSNQLRREGIKISVSTVRNILEENGYTPPRAVMKSERVFRYEAARPRELIHMDFKHFYINKQKVFLLLMQDDYSRFLCGYKLSDSENMDTVIEVFEECLSKYGRMQTLMTDAGSAFYSWNGFNRFQRLISEEYGIDHIKAKSPRSNGKIESVNKQIEKELLHVKEFASLGEAITGIGDWVEFYNFERTHMGLAQSEVPADRFLFGWNKTPVKKSSSKLIWEDIIKVAVDKM
jgi:putative transposase